MKKAPGHQPRKRFGQNFLHDSNVIDRIAKAISPKPDQHVVEIGPGLGALTEPLLNSGAKLTAVELDRDLVPVLRTKFFNQPNFNIVEADALQFDFATLISTELPNQKLRLVGNLPYNISTPLVFHLLGNADIVQDMHFMLQKEVVDRLAAKPGSGTYGRLSIMAQYHCQVEKVFDVGPGAFNPPPKVWSSIVRLRPYETLPLKCQDVKVFSRLVGKAFSMRRKTLRNSLRDEIEDSNIRTLGIDPQVRPENLAIEDFVKLADFVLQNPLVQ